MIKLMLLLPALCLFALSFTKAESGPTNKLPADAQAYHGHHYKVFLAHIPWLEARKKCEEAGGQLVSVNDAAEWEFIKELLNQANSPRAWLGGQRKDRKKYDFTWLDGTKISFDAPWHPVSLPNSTDFGAVLFVTKDKYFTFEPKPSDAKNMEGYVCEWNY